MIKDLKNSLIQVGLVGVLSFGAISSGFADPSASASASASMEQLPQFILNLGLYFGFDLNNPPTPSLTTTMPDSKSVAETQKMAIDLYLGTILDKSIIDPNSKSPLASILNQEINAIFKSGVFNTPSSSTQQPSTSISVSKLIDQTPWQSNPIDQTILNTLTTPDYSYCAQVPAGSCTTSQDSSGGNDLASRCCGDRAQYQIGTNVIGKIIPTAYEVFDALDSSTLNQLNGNTLIAPLLYTTSQNTETSETSVSSPSTTEKGLQAVNQVQAAENFIRYATGSVAPSPKTKFETYQTLRTQAYILPPNPTAAQLALAAAAGGTLSSYLASLRVIAAQTSVGVGNLYYILSKRMSQTPGSSTATSSTATSQALNEYTMATRRLYDPASKNSQWVDQMNTASAATVQKEIAVLLSEISYQLYLTRQQEERLLLTNTVMLFQLAHLVEPTPLQLPSQ